MQSCGPIFYLKIVVLTKNSQWITFFGGILSNKIFFKMAEYFQYAIFAFFVPCLEKERNKERKKKMY